MPAIIPFIPLIAAGVGAAGSVIGGKLANKSSQTSTPTLDPKFAGMQDLLLQTIQKRLASPTSLPPGYTGAGIRNINDSYDAAGKATENSLTTRGLAGSPVAANADLTRNLARGGDIGHFRSTVPLVERQLQNEDFGMGASLLNAGRGIQTTGTSGGGAGGAFTNLAGYLGYLQGKGIFGQQQPGIGTGMPSTAGANNWPTLPGYGTPLG
jgi:hypothetical protein